MRKIFDSPWFYYTLAALFLVGAVVSQIERPQEPEGKPVGTFEDIASLRDRDDLNVVFILIDTLRADRLGAYGYERNTSPNLDRIARHGIRFANTESQSSWTKASMASLWTGMYPERTGIQSFANALPLEAVTPAEIYRDEGYRTAGIWRNGWVANNFRFDQGFSLYVRPRTSQRDQQVRRRNPSAHGLVGTDFDATESAMEFFHSLGPDERFFLYIHYMDIHQYLYADISPDFGTSFSDFYDSSIFWVDYNIGILEAALREKGLLDRTVIVIASDHGEAFFEHGAEGHARDLYTEVLDVPLIVSLPFDLPQGVVVHSRAANVDIWPTLLDLMGMPPIPGAEGISLVPEIMEAGRAPGTQSPFVDRAIYGQLNGAWGKMDKDPEPLISISKGPFKYIARLDVEGSEELFDRAADPGERQNLAADQPDVAQELRAEVDAFIDRGGPHWGDTEEIELSEMHRAQLRALGYMVGGAEPRKKSPSKDEEGADANEAQDEAAPAP